MKIASVITSGEELNTLGIWLGCDPNDVTRLRNANLSIKDAAYQILCSYYYSVPDDERWENLIEAMKELNEHATVKELRLSGYHVDTPITIKAEPSDRPAVRPTAI